MEEAMAKISGDKKLYQRMRASGVRKSVARELARLPGLNSDDRQAPKAMHEAVERLDKIVSELRGHAVRGQRKATARTTARTRGSAQTRRGATRKTAGTGSAGARARRGSTRKATTARGGNARARRDSTRKPAAGRGQARRSVTRKTVKRTPA
jgi:hypothetical protein